jgi:hypothetical protein
MKITFLHAVIIWNMAPFIIVGVKYYRGDYPEDGGYIFLRDVDNHLQGFVAP